MIPHNVIGIVYGFYMPPALDDLPGPCGVLDLFSDHLRTRMPDDEFFRWTQIRHDLLHEQESEQVRGGDLYRVLMESLDYLHTQGDLRLHYNMLWMGVGVSVGGWIKDDRGNGVLPTEEAGHPMPLTKISRQARKTLDANSKRLITSLGRVVGRKPEWILLDATS